MRKNLVLRGVLLGALVASVLCVPVAQAQTVVTVDPAAVNVGYMNVFELDGTTFVFGQPWGFVDLTAVYAGSDLTLGATPINDPATPFWYISAGGPGVPGNKSMEANSYAEVTGPLAGQTVTFSGSVTANTLTGPHTVVAFVKDLAPDYSSSVDNTVPLPASGPFSVSLTTINDPTRHVQYGFQMVGPNAWPTDVAAFGTVTIAPFLVPVELTNFSVE